MQVDFIKRRQQKRIVQLEGYRALKGTEAQVDKLLGEFNARKELERNIQIERESRVSFSGGAFPRLKGRLPSPLVGRVLTKFGQVYDEATKLQIFKKGIEIATTVGKKIPVTAIFSGKIAFSGELPFYGRVAIIDHGDHYYSLCGHLGEISRKTGDKVSVGESIGYTDPSGSPLYFEIRSHNIAVNPLQWVSN
jgi:septal ring factor EnvC (AmiA/AmiB activator)